MNWNAIWTQLKPAVMIACMEAAAVGMEHTAKELRKEITKTKGSSMKTDFKKRYEPKMPTKGVVTEFTPNGTSVRTDYDNAPVCTLNNNATNLNNGTSAE